MNMIASPLLRESYEKGVHPHSFLRYNLVLGWAIVAVPLRLMAYRGAARMLAGTMVFDVQREEVFDLRLRTIDGEPNFVFATRRPDVVDRFRHIPGISR